jgi:hypothetical protein
VRNDKDISLPSAKPLLFAGARYQAREIVAGLNFRQTGKATISIEAGLLGSRLS